MRLPDFPDATGRTPQAVALDLDGTALDSSSRLSGKTAWAVLELIDLGIPVVIATARPERVIPVLVGPEIAARCSIVHMSGTAAVGRHPLKGDVWSPIDPEQANLTWQIVEGFRPAPRMTMEVDGRRFAVNHESRASELWTFNTATPDMILTLDEAMEAGPAKVSVNGLGENLSPMIEQLRAELNADTIVVPAAGNTFVNIHSANASKSGATAALIKAGGIGLDDVISFGDDLPDVDLMLNTGWPVAVENAIPEVKEAARFHTASNDDEGVALVLERLIEAVRRNDG